MFYIVEENSKLENLERLIKEVPESMNQCWSTDFMHDSLLLVGASEHSTLWMTSTVKHWPLRLI